MASSEGGADLAGTAGGEEQAVHADQTVLSAAVGMDQQLFFQGSTSEAIAKAAGKKLLVVFVAGEDEATTRLDSTTWADEALAARVREACVALRLPTGSSDASFFSAIYAVRTTPTIAIIGLNGSRLQWLEGYVTAEELKKHVEDANVTFQKQLQEAAAATMAAMLSAFQPSRQTATTAAAALASTPAPQPAASTPTPTPTTNPSPPSFPTPSPTNTPPPAPQATTPSSTADTTPSMKAADVPSPSRPSPSPSPSPSPLASSSSVDASNQATASKPKSSAIVADPKKTVEPSPQAAVARKAKPAKPVGSAASADVPTVRKPSEARASAAVPPNWSSGTPNLAAVAPRQEEDDGKVQVQFRLTDGTSVRGEFRREEKLRAAKQFVDRERTDGHGSYDLATPFPRHVFTEAEMDSTLEHLGFASRTALALLPRGGPDGAGPGRGDRGRPSTTPPGGATPVANQGQGWSLTGLVGGALSYVNPLSYLRGSTAATGSDSRDEAPPPPSGWEFDPNPMLERQVRMNAGGMLAAAGGGGAYGGGAQVPTGGAPSTSGSKRLVGNIHTFNRDGDEDDMTRRKNMFYNGNSTQFGGDGKDEGGGGGR